MIGASGLVWVNLIATQRAVEILSVFGCPSYIVQQVREGEVQYLRPLPEDDSHGSLIAVDLSALLDYGALQDVTLTATEQTTFLAFAAEMDDGEAYSSAIAAHRGWWLVTDDRVSLRVAGEYSPPIPTITTPEWMKFWADNASPDATTLAEVLRRIQICANYHPRRMHPLRGWWHTALLSS
jgi:hypothetical protein